MSESDHSSFTMSIGAVSRATGIPVNTLRTWERRYNFPTPLRTDSGQRQYRPEIVPHLRLISRALELGHRPRQILGLPIEQLRQLVGLAEPASNVERGPVNTWLKAALELDGETLDSGFRYECSRLGVEGFLTERASPFLTALGEAWASGELQVFHEHFASERLRDFLVQTWRPLSDRARGPYLICATLPGELHFMGLHMAASMVTLRGFRVIFLGTDTPLEDIRDCVQQSRAMAVMISASVWADPDQTLQHIQQLRGMLEPQVEILLGGRGGFEVNGVIRLAHLRELSDWSENRGLRS